MNVRDMDDRQAQLVKLASALGLGIVGFSFFGPPAFVFGLVLGWAVYLLLRLPFGDDPEMYVVLWVPTVWNQVHVGLNRYRNEPADRLDGTSWMVLSANIILAIAALIMIFVGSGTGIAALPFANPLVVEAVLIASVLLLGNMSYVIDDLEGRLWKRQRRNLAQGSLPHPGHFLSNLLRMAGVVGLLVAALLPFRSHP